MKKKIDNNFTQVFVNGKKVNKKNRQSIAYGECQRACCFKIENEKRNERNRIKCYLNENM